MSIWRGVMDRSAGRAVRLEDSLNVINLRESAEGTSLSKELVSKIEVVLKTLRDAPCWSSKVRPSNYEPRLGQNVELSDKRKTYLELFIDRHLLPENEDERDKGIVEVLGVSRVLGEYDNGVIILYVNNIMDVASEEDAPEGVCGMPYLTVMRYVYLHELMHAYFNHNNDKGYEYDHDTEEGLAEFGALLFLNELVNHDSWKGEPPINYATKEELEWAIRHVEGKTGPLQCYAHGAELFKKYGNDTEMAKKLLESYPSNLKK
jgi:hypothetical protein